MVLNTTRERVATQTPLQNWQSIVHISCYDAALLQGPISWFEVEHVHVENYIT